jgi:N-methylhydantoinase A
MPRLYDLTWEKPPPLVERYLRAEVDERVSARGEVQRPLDPAEVEHVLDRLLAERIEALAVCLIHSYVNPAHEKQIQEIVARRAPDLLTSVSAGVLPEIREYERRRRPLSTPMSCRSCAVTGYAERIRSPPASALSSRSI